ncbi:hypothetical protein STVIR_3345 [Streptomyces viridochromogenes Tue57]|uniref:Uncharacterized protein n=2 Tax=Streptomyces viridochromogenes TaxID=1938 RepID=L8PI45_STRVR|nr:hypothetical protein STVIR_3345 [Streptomyces viridochromogenes Tue57]
MDPVDIVVTWAGYGLLGLAGLLIGLVCLVGLMLSAMVALGRLVGRREEDDLDASGRGAAGEETGGLASFRWEAEPGSWDTR